MISEIRKVSLSLCLLGMAFCQEANAQQAGGNAGAGNGGEYYDADYTVVDDDKDKK